MLVYGDARAPINRFTAWTCRRRSLADYLNGETRLEYIVAKALYDVYSADVVQEAGL